MYDYLNYVQMYSYLNGKKYSKEYPVQPEPLRTAEHIVISDGVTYIGRNAFGSQGVGRTVTVEIGKAVKIIGEEAFYKCNITEIVIPDSVTEIGERAFQYSDIEKLTLGLSVKTIGNEAFSVNNHKSIIIPDSVISIGDYAFYGNDLLEYIELGKSVKTVGKLAFCLSDRVTDDYEWDYTPVVRYIVPKTVTKIGENAFGFADVDGESQRPMKDFTVVGKVSSAAYKYCQKYLVEFDDVDGCEKDTHIWGGKQCVKEKVCRKTSGTYATQCIKCGARRYEKGTTWDHDFIEETTKTVKKATYFKEGKEKTYCTTCKKYITQKTKKLSIESNVKVTAGKKKINVKYTKAKNADGFQIKYKVNGKDVTKTFNTTKSVTKSISKLAKGGYTVRVRAFDKTDSGKLYSDWVTYSVKVK